MGIARAALLLLLLLMLRLLLLMMLMLLLAVVLPIMRLSALGLETVLCLRARLVASLLATGMLLLLLLLRLRLAAGATRVGIIAAELRCRAKSRASTTSGPSAAAECAGHGSRGATTESTGTTVAGVAEVAEGVVVAVLLARPGAARVRACSNGALLSARTGLALPRLTPLLGLAHLASELLLLLLLVRELALLRTSGSTKGGGGPAGLRSLTARARAIGLHVASVGRYPAAAGVGVGGASGAKRAER